MRVYVTDKTKSIQYVAVCRPLPSTENRLTHLQFLTETEQFLDEICVVPGQRVILGDFNVHVNKPNK